MPFVIGTDEAGYGPNLGPLVVSATVWEVDDGIDAAALYKQLRKVVARGVDRSSKNRIAWADSKAVYKNGVGLDHLERGVLTALALLGRLPNQWQQLWNALDPRCATRMGELPWHDGYAAALPLWLKADGLADAADGVRAGLEASGVRLIDLSCRAVFPGEFNELVDASNKADALSRTTLALIGEALQFIPSGAVHVYCDKHGGRDYYLPLLQAQFSEDWIEVRQQSGEVSQYRFGSDERRVEIGFYVGGERFLPVALASMTAKYLRETAMRPFNEYWCGRIPGLKPTAGYPMDSWRFKKQIAATQGELGIEDRILWRSR